MKEIQRGRGQDRFLRVPDPGRGPSQGRDRDRFRPGQDRGLFQDQDPGLFPGRGRDLFRVPDRGQDRVHQGRDQYQDLDPGQGRGQDQVLQFRVDRNRVRDPDRCLVRGQGLVLVQGQGQAREVAHLTVEGQDRVRIKVIIFLC